MTIYLSVRRATWSVCIERLTGRSVHSLEYRVGDMLPLNVGGAPRVLLSYLPSEERDAVILQLRQERPKDSVITNPDFRPEIEQIRRCGWSKSVGDVTPGIAAIGAPVFNHRGEVVAAVSAAGLQNEVMAQGDLKDQVVACAAEISRALGFQKGMKA